MDPISSARSAIEIKWDTPYRILGSIAGLFLLTAGMTRMLPHDNVIFVAKYFNLSPIVEWTRAFVEWMHQYGEWVAALATPIAMGAILTAVAKLTPEGMHINQRRAPATALIALFFMVESGQGGWLTLLVLTVAGRAIFQHLNPHGMPAWLWLFMLPIELVFAALYLVLILFFWMLFSDEEMKRDEKGEG